MSTGSPSPKRLAEVARLCTLLADRVLDAQIMGRPVPPEQIAALVKAAGLLQDHGGEWPPLLEQVLHDLAREDGEDDTVAPGAPPAAKALGDVDLGGLTRFFSGLRKTESQP